MTMLRKSQRHRGKYLVHGTCVFLNGATFLIQGPSGVGKSDLALRLIYEQSARLIADDYTLLEQQGPSAPESQLRWRASCPPELRALLEVREIGLVTLSEGQMKEEGTLDYVVSLSPNKQERLPERESCPSLRVPVYRLSAQTASLTAKVIMLSLACRANLLQDNTQTHEDPFLRPSE